MKLTLKQAYMSMFYYLCSIWNKVKDDKTIYNIDDFSAFMGGINPFLFKGSMSADPAAWEDWISCVNKIESNNSEEIMLTSVEAFDCMISFVKFYIDDL
ncbi:MULTISPECIES: hypothetical protein [Clostridium]|uniref:hypothetical protein n=1 Tax=Clostridium TaxID=1485 RepID=UPI0008269135|nr:MULTISPECIES: hypothetical protein [Clostridium]PJI07264.1 hypothetical protein CUB90_05030 [Clostridium sp. CT7]